MHYSANSLQRKPVMHLSSATVMLDKPLAICFISHAAKNISFLTTEIKTHTASKTLKHWLVCWMFHKKADLLKVIFCNKH